MRSLKNRTHMDSPDLSMMRRTFDSKAMLKDITNDKERFTDFIKNQKNKKFSLFKLLKRCPKPKSENYWEVNENITKTKKLKRISAFNSKIISKSVIM